MSLSVSLGGTTVLSLLLSGFICVGSVSAAEKLDVQRAVILALHNNGELNAFRQERGVHEAGKTRAALLPNPVLEADLSTGKLTGSPSENAFYIGVSQEFTTMGKRGKRVEVAKRDIEIFDRQLENSARLLAEEVKTAFYDLLLAQKKAELSERSLALANQLLEVTKQRLDAGDIPELEVNLALVEVARSEARKAEAERDLYSAKAKLLALLGLRAAEDANFVGNLEPGPQRLELARLKELALANRPDLRSLESEKAKGDAELMLAQAERFPNVTAGLGYQRQNSSTEVAGLEGMNRDNLIALKLSVPIPLFDKNQAAVQEAQARRGRAETRHAFARQVVEREVEGAYARLATADKSLDIYSKRIMPQLEENLNLVQEAYRLGEVGILAVIEENRKFFEISDGFLMALYNRQAALAKLEAAVGRDLHMESTGGQK